MVDCSKKIGHLLWSWDPYIFSYIYDVGSILTKNKTQKSKDE